MWSMHSMLTRLGGVLLHVPLQHRPCATAAHLLQSLHHWLPQPLMWCGCGSVCMLSRHPLAVSAIKWLSNVRLQHDSRSTSRCLHLTGACTALLKRASKLGRFRLQSSPCRSANALVQRVTPMPASCNLHLQSATSKSLSKCECKLTVEAMSSCLPKCCAAALCQRHQTMMLTQSCCTALS